PTCTGLLDGFGSGRWLVVFLEGGFTKLLVGKKRNRRFFGNTWAQDGSVGVNGKLFIGSGRVNQQVLSIFGELCGALLPENGDSVEPGLELLLGFARFDRSSPELGKEACWAKERN